MSTLILEVVTPQRRILSRRSRKRDCTGAGRLPGHPAWHASLRLNPGVVSYRKPGKTEFSGCLRRHNGSRSDKVIILADVAELKEEIDVERAQRAKERAEQRLRKRPPGLDPERAEFALQRSKARLKAAGSKK